MTRQHASVSAIRTAAGLDLLTLGASTLTLHSVSLCCATSRKQRSYTQKARNIVDHCDLEYQDVAARNTCMKRHLERGCICVPDNRSAASKSLFPARKLLFFSPPNPFSARRFRIRCQPCRRVVHVVRAVRPSVLGDSPHRRAIPGMEEKARQRTAGSQVRSSRPPFWGLLRCCLPSALLSIDCTVSRRSTVLRPCSAHPRVVSMALLNVFVVLPRVKS